MGDSTQKKYKNKFSNHFVVHNFTWRLVLASTEKHMVFLEHLGYLTFDIFAEYILYIIYTDEEEEEKHITCAFGTQLEFGTEIQDKEVKEVKIRIEKANRCYEVRKETPYAGMVNLGATCYLNTIVQTLYHIKGFVQELFKQKLGKKTHEMQKLFYQLDTETQYVQTVAFANAYKLNEPLDDSKTYRSSSSTCLTSLRKKQRVQSSMTT